MIFLNDMSQAELGDTLTHDNGSEWEVVGFCDHPTVILRHVDAAKIDPLDRDILSVVPYSPWADKWKFAEQPSADE